MSRATLGVASSGSSFLDVEVEGLEEVAAAIGWMPPALAGTIGELNADLVNHHKRSVIKNHSFVAGDRARRFVASRLFGYGGRTRRPTDLDDVQGESFLASRETTNQDFPLDRRSLLFLETGGTVRGAELMAVPVGPGRPFRGVFQNVPIWAKLEGGLRGALMRGELTLASKTAGGLTLILDLRDRSRKRAEKRGELDQDGHLVVGVMKRTRRQPPKLGFMREFDRILPKHLAKYDQAVDLAMTAAGRESLSRRLRASAAGRDAFRATFQEFLAANPGNKAGARKAAEAARRAARSRRLSR